MKVKQAPNDFIVCEESNARLVPEGSYSFYRLAKQGIGTIEAINILCRELNIPRESVSFGGLKDKYALTEQLISIRRGPKRDFSRNLFSVKYLGKTDDPVKPDSLVANRFKVILRDLTDTEAGKIGERLKEIESSGLPNYFDEQRFGSVRGGDEFIAKELIRRNYEGSLKIALTFTLDEGKSGAKKIRQILLENWGDWAKCFSLLPESSERRIINYLKGHPSNLRQAFELLDEKLVLLYLHAYQSYLWNKGLSRLLGNYIDDASFIKVPYILGDFLFYNKMPHDKLKLLRELNIPFITHKTVFTDKNTERIFLEILKEEGLELAEFRIRGMAKTYFRKGSRAAIVFPRDIYVKAFETDELNGGKLKLAMEFSLPRGSYATIIIKRISYDLR